MTKMKEIKVHTTVSMNDGQVRLQSVKVNGVSSLPSAGVLVAYGQTPGVAYSALCQGQAETKSYDVLITGLRNTEGRITPDTLPDFDILSIYHDNYTAEVRELMVSAMAEMQNIDDVRKELAGINSIASLLRFIKTYPQGIDHIHLSKHFSHLKAIGFVIGNEAKEGKFCTLYNIAPENIRVPHLQSSRIVF
jgi:hypothetical protein